MAYEDLMAIYDEAYELAVQEEQEPWECPNDGTILLKNEAGVLHCKFDGWIYKGFGV